MVERDNDAKLLEIVEDGRKEDVYRRMEVSIQFGGII